MEDRYQSASYTKHLLKNTHLQPGHTPVWRPDCINKFSNQTNIFVGKELTEQCTQVFPQQYTLFLPFEDE